MIGEKLLHYEVTAPLGEGGMGLVYRATDTRLGREVAIKVLPEAFVADAERLARFQREAQLLAALNHPNIGGIHGLEEAGATRFLVLELIEGEDLADRLTRGAMPVAEALPVAVQLAQALEAAHAQGIVHRDLKPANIKLTPEGQVKVLDFGLAKAWDQPTDSGLTHSPTLTAQMTQAGVILGTASYMSPEQARGQETDKRSDIWSFGVVLFEMLTGGRIYPGETVTDILGAIVHKEPDWERLPANLPASIERLLERCLEKDVQRRVQDVGDARIEIEDGIERGDDAPIRLANARPPRAVRFVPWAIAAAAVLVSVWSLMGPRKAPQAHPPLARLTISLPESRELHRGHAQTLAISPDGSQVVYAAGDEEGEGLFLFDRQTGETRSFGDDGAHQVTFSPDGRWVAFRQGGAIRKVALDGGSSIRLAPQSDRTGLDWSDRGEIVYSPDWGVGLYRVSAEGGETEAITALDVEAGDGAHMQPEVLPGGESVLFVIWDSGGSGQSHIAATRLGTGEHRVVLRDATTPRYSATGHLLFVRGDTLMAVPFDAEGLAVTGDAVALETGVRYYNAYLAAIYDIAADGTLVFQGGGAVENLRELAWVSPSGEVTPALEDQRPFADPRISPDGRRVGVTVEASLFQIWIYDLATGTRSQLTHESDNGGVDWMPDGREVVFWTAQLSPYGIMKMAADGSAPPEVVARSEGDTGNPAISPDGDLVLFEAAAGGRSSDVLVVDLEDESSVRPFRATEADERGPRFSPDGRWVAYTSNESGVDEVYVASFPGPGSSWLISSGGGGFAEWSRDGRQLFYRNGDQMWAVDVETVDELRVERPRLLFETPGIYDEFDIAADGSFLIIRNLDPDSPYERRIEVTLNWPELLVNED